MIFVDTNFFLRFLLFDVDSQYQEAKKLFIDASDGKTSLATSLVVIFEVYWVLLGQFKNDKQKVINVLETLFKLRFIDMEDFDLLSESLELYKITNIGLVDVFNMVYAKSKKASDFKTFDKKLYNQWKLLK